MSPCKKAFKALLAKISAMVKAFCSTRGKTPNFGSATLKLFWFGGLFIFGIFLGQVLVFFWIPAYLLFLLTCFSCSLLSLLIFFSAIVLLCLSTYTILLFLFCSYVFLLLHFLLLCFFTSCLYCLFVFHVLLLPVCILNEALERP